MPETLSFLVVAKTAETAIRQLFSAAIIACILVLDKKTKHYCLPLGDSRPLSSTEQKQPTAMATAETSHSVSPSATVLREHRQEVTPPRPLRRALGQIFAGGSAGKR